MNDQPPVIEAIVAWVYDDREGKTRLLGILVPPGRILPAMIVEGDPNEEGLDVIARRYARSGRVRARKVRFIPVDEDLEVVDGRV
jgi:hypothetical protein